MKNPLRRISPEEASYLFPVLIRNLKNVGTSVKDLNDTVQDLVDENQEVKEEIKVVEKQNKSLLVLWTLLISFITVGLFATPYIPILRESFQNNTEEIK